MMHLNPYINRLKTQSPGAAESVKKTAEEISEKLDGFTFKEHILGLILGQIQSGKTSHVFGIIAAAADLGFDLFVLLTTDNVYLQEQTFRRAIDVLDTFTVCGENDEIRFMGSGMRKPALIILKKNSRVLQKWLGNLSSSGFCEGRALFIIDDEGDAASLNTKINADDQSAVNARLEAMKKLANSSVYLQVTATPQPLLLQTKESGWKPSFVHYFEPGKGYLGGDFFYPERGSYAIKLTKENELDDIINDQDTVPEGLQSSLLSFLVSGAHIMLTGGKVCNLLIHPSVRIADHEAVANRIGQMLNDILSEIQGKELTKQLKEVWADLQATKPDLADFDAVYKYIQEALSNEEIGIILMNSTGTTDKKYGTGLNIIIGGNSLSRGVTFDGLQTVYYCRRAKTPQADTFWQHCRMFGYDRDPGLMRVFIPPYLHKLFSELNRSNETLLNQIQNHGIDDISLLYPPGVKPTRKNVIDQSALNIIVGGVNFFPFYPKRKLVSTIDELLEDFDDKQEFHVVPLELMLQLVELFESEKASDWPTAAYANCIRVMIQGKQTEGILIVRRNRDIGKETGTLLSPNDRKLGDKYSKDAVLTLYRLTGNQEKGWDGKPLWVPNIKFPSAMNFYKTE